MGVTADVVARAANVVAPISNRVIVLSVNDTAATFVVPAGFYGKYATFMMDGADADIVFGFSTVSCTYGQTSGVASGVITVNAASGGHLKNGVAVAMTIPDSNKATHFSVDCVGAGSGKLYITIG